MVQPSQSARLAIIIVIALVLVLVFIWRPATDTCPSFTDATLTINNQTISVGLAVTPEEQRQGLSGCPEVPANHGLYFPQDPPRPATFWMKDMLILIDIVWIKDNQVIGIEHNVSPPNMIKAPDYALPTYQSPGPVTAVLELAAGEANRLGIDSDSSVLVNYPR